MALNNAQIAFITEQVGKFKLNRTVASAYARMDAGRQTYKLICSVTMKAAFIQDRDSFYMASVSEN